MLLAGCSQSDSLPVVGAPSLQGNASLHISAATLQVSQERSVSRAVTSDALTAGSIGVFRSQGTGYAEAQDNKEYSYVSGVWQPKVPAQTVHLMANDARVCAYYPYNAAYTNKTAIPLASGKYTGVVDDLTRHAPCRPLLRHRPVDERLQAFHPVRAEPRHGNGAAPAPAVRPGDHRSQAHFGKHQECRAGKPCHHRYHRRRLYRLGQGAATVDTRHYRHRDLPASSTSEATSALLVPCTLDASGTTFGFTVDGKSMTIKVSAAKLPAFEAGKIHRLIFDIKASSASLEQVSIIDWWREWDEAGEPGIDGSLKDYIELGGVKWALSNLEHNAAYHNYNFAASATAEGTKLKWNALTVADGGNPATTWDAASDPCSCLEPKDTWVSPTKENFAALAALPSVWVTGYEGVNGRWFGTADAAEAALNPGRYLFSFLPRVRQQPLTGQNPITPPRTNRWHSPSRRAPHLRSQIRSTPPAARYVA